MRIRQNFLHSMTPSPALYICSTPIGNLGDVSSRLVETLSSVDVIAAEDTRHTRKLLSRFDIHPAQLISCHEHNELTRRDDFVRWWSDGKTVALVSDAGTPAISDPGWIIVDMAIEAGVPVIPVPGPSALLAALVASGLPVQPFAFFGFLPRQKAEARTVLTCALAFPGTVVLYEAPHRLVRTLEALASQAPQRRLVLAKELTKTHETMMDGTIEEVSNYFQNEEPRGEYVLCLAPSPSAQGTMSDEEAEREKLKQAIDYVTQQLAGGISHADAVRLAAARFGMKRRLLYQETLGLVNE